ncbi:PAS domain S-box-containing protein [Insolitispirillum peregrinum]|uniref:histidine kinase n=1 Tax=Insolitispirillum peregrinum TaxID=80876 RepID=A0A1N7LIU3_9PROT|nr:PAS domain S-box-containing protein [Insolitispirillum peregrinum]
MSFPAPPRFTGSNPLSLRRAVLLATLLLAILSCFAFFLAATQIVSHSLQDEAVENLRSTTLQARDRVERQLRTHFRDAAAAAIFLQRSDLSPDVIATTLTLFRNAFQEQPWISVTSPDGIIRHANPKFLEGASVVQRPWFKGAQSVPYMGAAQDAEQRSVSPIAGQNMPLIDFAFPLRTPEQTLAGVFSVHLGWAWANDALRPFENNGRYTILIVDSEGQIIQGPHDRLGSLLSHSLPAQDGTLWESPGGILSAIAHAPPAQHQPGLRWSVVLEAQKADIFALISPLQKALFMVSGGIILLAIIAAILLARYLARPIEMLESAIRDGQDIPPCSQFRETASLSRSFADLLSRLHSERNAIETLVQQRTAELQDLLRTVDAHSIISMTDASGTIAYCNDQFCQSSGYDRTELLGQSHRLLKSGRHSPQFYQDLWESLLQGKIWQGVLCNKSKTGQLYWLQTTICPTHSDDTTGIRYISIHTDITRMMEAQRQLEIFRRIIEATDEGVSILDSNGRYLYGNPARERMTGFTNDDLGNNTISWVWTDDTEPLHREICSALARGQSWRGLLPVRRKDGSSFISASNLGVITEEHSGAQFIFNVFQDHTQELARTRALEEAHHHAVEASKAKSTFLSNMSHELRTPLNAILGFAQLMLSNPKVPVTDLQRRQLNYILKGGEHLLSLINEVLDLAKIEAGKMSLSVEPTALGTVVQEALVLASRYIENAAVTVDCQDPATMPCIMADPTRAKQVVVNLLSNAAKYNRPNGIIRLFGEYHDSHYRLVIEDCGFGIPAEKQAQLFQPFSRLGAELSDIEGTGVGLALSKTLMEIMHGQIGFNSIAGQGSRFWLEFQLPTQPDTTSAPSLLPGADLSQHAIDADGLTLYIEDNPANIALMELMFSEFTRLSLAVAQTGAAGLEMAERLRPALIILDINLPDMSGLEVLTRLKQRPDLCRIPVIVLTADATPQTRQRAEMAGCSAFLSKPVNLSELTARIQSLVKQAEKSPA